MNHTKEENRVSFRDPTGSVFLLDQRLFREIRKPFGEDIRRLLTSAFFLRNCTRGHIAETRITSQASKEVGDEAEGIEFILEHQRIPFPIYPHEWIPGMLHDAGRLTLDLAEEAMSDGWILKDATPWNILYSDGRPIFCDIPSFVPARHNGIWNAYAQFQRTFLLPLHAFNAHAWPPHMILLERRDGLDPLNLDPVTRGWNRWRPFELEAIVLPSKLSRVSAKRREALVEQAANPQSINMDRSNFILGRSYRRLGKQLELVRPSTQKTQWTYYDTELSHYSTKDREVAPEISAGR